MTDSLTEIRARIDGIDRAIVELLAQRWRCVQEAAHHKRNDQEVAAPARVEQVIGKVRAHALALQAPADLVEAVYRLMIAQFIALERGVRRDEP